MGVAHVVALFFGLCIIASWIHGAVTYLFYTNNKKGV